MAISVIQIIMLLGAVQGVFFSGFAFFSKKYKSSSNFFLGMLILTFSYNIIQNYLFASGILTNYSYFQIFYIPFSSVFLVLFYLYVKSFLNQNRKVSKSDYLLFIPFFNAFTESVFEKIGFAVGWFNNSHVVYFNNFRIGMETFNVFYSFILIFASYRLILKADGKPFTGKTGFPKPQLKWLKIITIILFCLCVYWVVPLYYEFQYKLDTSLVLFYALWVGLSLTIYILGHVGLYHFGVFEEQKKIREFSKSNPEIEIDYTQNKNIAVFEKFIKQDKNYLDSNLSLELVAEKINISKSHLSRIINAELGKNFSDYVNELRVEEAKSYLENPDFQNYTLVAIGLEAGFNSKTTFNNAFKKFTGITPLEYKRNFTQNTR
ncbi:MAG: AraC family transcriptional regulator [Bergeyella sp.]